MYYLVCPNCRNRNDSNSDVLGTQYSCNRCRHIFIVESVYYDTPTRSIPRKDALKMRIVTSNEQPPKQEPKMRIIKQTENRVPSLNQNALPSPQTHVGMQKKSPVKRKVKPRSSSVKRKVKQKSSKTQTERKKNTIPAVKKQSSFSPQVIIIIIVALLTVATLIAILSSQKKSTVKKGEKAQSHQIQSKKKTGNMFLDML